jgi:hypothetical protein
VVIYEGFYIKLQNHSLEWYPNSEKETRRPCQYYLVWGHSTQLQQPVKWCTSDIT